MNLFKTKFDAATIVLIPACIGINYLGKMFASLLKLPLWLDSIGTCIGGCLGGPIIGGICGAANNLIYGFEMLGNPVNGALPVDEKYTCKVCSPLVSSLSR